MRLFNRLFVLIAILSLGLVAVAAVYYQKPLTKKHLGYNSSPTKQELPILREADRYTLAISRLDFKTARGISSPENMRLLESLVKPKLSYWTSISGLSKLIFSSVKFNNALLVNENLDDLIVTEILNFPRPIAGCQGFYLKFNIKKVGNRFRVENTDLIEKTSDKLMEHD